MPGNRVLRREKLLPVRHVRSAPLPWLDEMMTERDPDCRKCRPRFTRWLIMHSNGWLRRPWLERQATPTFAYSLVPSL